MTTDAMLLYWAVGASAVALVIGGLALHALANWQRRIARLEMLRRGDWDMIVGHQDLIANHERRLIRLGTPGSPVPSMDELIELHRRQATSGERPGLQDGGIRV